MIVFNLFFLNQKATTNHYRIIFHSYANLVYYTQIFNKTNETIKLHVIDDHYRSTTQLLSSHDSCFLITPPGKNTAQIINNDGKAVATYTVLAELSVKDPIGFGYSSPINRCLNKFVLIIVKTKSTGYDFRIGEWIDYGKSVREF
jgi:hypothetical protein